MRKTLTILSLVGLVLSVGLWGASYFQLHYRKKPVHVEVSKGGVSLVHGGLTQEERELRLALLNAHVRSFRMEWDEIKGEFVRVDQRRESSEVTELKRDFDTLQQRQLWVEGFAGLEMNWFPRLLWTPSQRSLYIPMWITTLLFGVGLVFPQAFFRFHRRRRRKLGLCVKCGYDLRASKDRCPECGTGIEEKVTEP